MQSKIVITKCVNCEFNIRADAEFCPNCGLTLPAEPFEYSDEGLNFAILFLTYAVFILVFTPFVFLTISVDSNDKFQDRVYYSALIAAALSIFPGYSLSGIITMKRFRKEKKRRLGEKTACLIYKEQKISDVIFELSERDVLLFKQSPRVFADSYEDFEEMGEDVLPFHELNETEKIIYDTQKIVNQQIYLCYLLENKIEIARLENSILPYIAAQQNLNEKEIEEGMREIEAVLETLGEMRLTLEEDDESELPEITAEREKIQKCVEHSKRFCERKREELSSRQTSPAIQYPNEFTQNFPAIAANEKMRTLEIYDETPILPAFFDELESEYWRLHDEINMRENILSEKLT